MNDSKSNELIIGELYRIQLKPQKECDISIIIRPRTQFSRECFYHDSIGMYLGMKSSSAYGIYQRFLMSDREDGFAPQFYNFKRITEDGTL